MYLLVFAYTLHSCKFSFVLVNSFLSVFQNSTKFFVKESIVSSVTYLNKPHFLVVFFRIWKLFSFMLVQFVMILLLGIPKVGEQCIKFITYLISIGRKKIYLFLLYFIKFNQQYKGYCNFIVVHKHYQMIYSNFHYYK